MKLKRFIAVAMATTLACSMVLTGCGGSTTSSTASTGSSPASGDATGKIKVEIVAKGFQHDFWKAVRTGAEKAAGELGAEINFVGPDSESAIAQQVEMINTAINKKPAAICLAALDTKASLDAIAKAQAAKIPIVGFDSGVPDAPAGSVVANAATDNYVAGELAAENMYKAMKDRIVAAATGDAIRIGVVAQDATSESIGQRTKGFVDKMVELIENTAGYGKDKVAVEGHTQYVNKVDAKAAKTIIEVNIPTEITDAAGTTIAQTLLNKADLSGIYGSNEFSAKCIITADGSLNKLGMEDGKVMGCGFDSGELQLDAIKNGKFIGSVTQDPVSIGYKAVELAVKASKGEKVENVDTGAKWYTKENMEDPAIAPCLYK